MRRQLTEILDEVFARSRWRTGAKLWIGATYLRSCAQSSGISMILSYEKNGHRRAARGRWAIT